MIKFYFPVIFEDSIRAKLILATADPKEHKKLGRQVKNFDKVTWGRKSVEVVKKGSEYKVLYKLQFYVWTSFVHQFILLSINITFKFKIQ